MEVIKRKIQERDDQIQDYNYQIYQKEVYINQLNGIYQEWVSQKRQKEQEQNFQNESNKKKKQTEEETIQKVNVHNKDQDVEKKNQKKVETKQQEIKKPTPKKRSSNVFQDIYDNDTEQIFPFTYVPDSFQGDFIVHVNHPKYGQSSKDHHLLVLYKWNSKKYVMSSPKELLSFEKFKIYKLIFDLFDNYNPDENEQEVKTKTEIKEEQIFIDHISMSESFQIAYEYVRDKFGLKMNQNDWKNEIKRIWFTFYNLGKRKDVSAFEHTFVGEMAQGKAIGYHFWFKYLTDDSSMNMNGKDIIDFGHTVGDKKNPDYIAVKFDIDFQDIDGNIQTNQFEKTSKPISSFFVGISPISLILMGTIVYYHLKESNQDEESSFPACINQRNYDMTCHFTHGKKNLRTFFPLYFQKN